MLEDGKTKKKNNNKKTKKPDSKKETKNPDNQSNLIFNFNFVTIC